MYRSSFRTVLSLVSLALLLGACSDQPPTSPRLAPSLSVGSESAHQAHIAVCPTTESHRTEGVLGPRGGSLHVAGHRLTVPPDVLTEATSFTLYAPAGQEVRLELSAQGAEHYQFAAPVVVTISYDRCRRQRPSASIASAWYIDDSGETLRVEPMRGKDDRKRKAVTFPTTHFSTYVVAY
jgi:hypothetical protein